MIICTYTVIKGNRIDNHKFVKIIFEWNVISMPSYYIEWTMVLLGDK